MTDRDKKATSYRLLPVTFSRLKALSKLLGLPQSSVIDEAVKEKADREGVEVKKSNLAGGAL